METERVLILEEGSRQQRAWCSACAAVVDFVAVDPAAQAAQCSARQVFRTVEEGRVHFMETPGGKFFICAPSLRLLIESEIPGEVTEES